MMWFQQMTVEQMQRFMNVLDISQRASFMELLMLSLKSPEELERHKLVDSFLVTLRPEQLKLIQ